MQPGEPFLGLRRAPEPHSKSSTTASSGLCRVLLDNPLMFGYCYTQLTDVYQEQNGIYTFDRQPKFELARLRDVQERPAAIEMLDVEPRSLTGAREPEC